MKMSQIGLRLQIKPKLTDNKQFPYLHHCLHHHYSSHFRGYSSSLVRNLLLLDWQDQATHNFVLHQYQERPLQQPQLDLRLSVVESLFDSIDRLIFNRPHNRLNPIMKEQSYFLEEKKIFARHNQHWFSVHFFVHKHEKLILKKI